MNAVKTKKVTYNLKKRKSRHVCLLLYWLIFAVIFWPMEFLQNRNYHEVYCYLDSLIPFCKYFVIPYFLWFLYMIFTISYYFFKDVESFVKVMLYIIITYSVTLLIYFIYPTCQNLRLDNIGEGFLEKIIYWLWGYDTNTNVCPSIHVIGSFAIYFSVINSKIKNKSIVFIYGVLNILISISTVFIKQHSIIDVIVALVICFLAYPMIYHKNSLSRKLVSFFCNLEPATIK